MPAADAMAAKPDDELRQRLCSLGRITIGSDKRS